MIHWFSQRRFFLIVYLAVVGMCLLAPARTSAQRWSYIYIQSDQDVPFYVRLDGHMLPRYSKYYSIIPRLAPGPLRLELLFEQHKYPALFFNIQVPASGSRAFLLIRNNEAYALYDLQQKFYLAPGDAGEDHLPEITKVPLQQPADSARSSAIAQTDYTAYHPAEDTAAKANPGIEPAPAFIPDVDLRNHAPDTASPPPPVANNPAAAANTNPEVTAETPENPVEMNVTPSPNPNPSDAPLAPRTEPEPTRTESEPDLGRQLSPIKNSDCPSPISDKDFDDLYNNTISKEGDDKRILFLMRQVKTTCLTCRQAATLAAQLETEAMRYSFLKKAYPRVTDQEYFQQLGQLFKTREWREYFRLIQ